MNEQEKIQYPDRTAKKIRESPQLSNLLDDNGEGLLEMEEQQKRQIQEIEKEHTIREMAGHTAGSTAEIKAAAIARMQQRHASGGTNTAQPKRRGAMKCPEVFDMAVDDDDDFKTDVTDAINKQEANVMNKENKIKNLVEQNLGHEVPQPIPYLLTAQPASSSSSSARPASSSSSA